MIRVENNTVEVRGSDKDITYDLTILLNTLMKKHKQADTIIKCAVMSARDMIKAGINGTDLSDSVNVTLKRPR